MPCKTIIVDSSNAAAILMNSNNSNLSLGKDSNITWLGRSGISEFSGIRIAYVSGIDSDILGSEVYLCDPSKQYIGNYFTKSDIENVIN